GLLYPMYTFSQIYNYSSRRATSGSTLVARLAGPNIAIDDATANNTVAQTKMNGSHTSRSNSLLFRTICAIPKNAAVVSASPITNRIATGRPLDPSAAR